MEDETAAAGRHRRDEPPRGQERRLLEIIREMGFGELRIIVNDGKPVRIEELKRSIKL